MNTQNIANLVLICLGVFVTGVSLTLLAPFYPSEALKKVKIYHSLSWISRLSKYPTTNPLLKGVSVTQSGVVMSAVFIATIVFTPLFGKVNITFFGNISYLLLTSLPKVHENSRRPPLSCDRGFFCWRRKRRNGIPRLYYWWQLVLWSFDIYSHRDSDRYSTVRDTV